MFQPFKMFGRSPVPNTGFYHVQNYVRDNIVPGSLEQVEFEFTPVEMKRMYRPSLSIRAYDEKGEIAIVSCGVLGSKLLIQLERRTGNNPHIKAEWEERYLYDS